MNSERWYDRTVLLLGEERFSRLQQAHVLVVGLGGVGAYAAEMIVRAGVGRLTMVDADSVQPTNINRQLCALHSTIGRNKTEVLAARYKDINPELELTVRPEYLDEEMAERILDEAHYDFVVDAIDTISPKCALIMGGHETPDTDSQQYGSRSQDGYYADPFCQIFGKLIIVA